MAAIKGRDTKPELKIRKALHALGFRYRMHAKELPGKPDLVLPKYKAVVFINGCFWHQHDCAMFKWPLTRVDFWREKIDRNVSNDVRNLEALKSAGWRVATLWECSIKGKARIGEEIAVRLLVDWLKSEKQFITIRGAV